MLRIAHFGGGGGGIDDVGGGGGPTRVRWREEERGWQRRGNLHSLGSHDMELKLEREECCRKVSTELERREMEK